MNTSPVTEQTVKPFIESALRWHAVFDDGRGGNDLTLDQTADLIAARLIAAIGAPAQCAPDREQIAKLIEFNCHRIAMIKLYEPRLGECRKLADAALSVTSTERHEETVPRRLLNERDDFIVNKGLWSEFMASLSSTVQQPVENKDGGAA